MSFSRIRVLQVAWRLSWQFIYWILLYNAKKNYGFSLWLYFKLAIYYLVKIHSPWKLFHFLNIIYLIIFKLYRHMVSIVHLKSFFNFFPTMDLLPLIFFLLAFFLSPKYFSLPEPLQAFYDDIMQDGISFHAIKVCVCGFAFTIFFYFLAIECFKIFCELIIFFGESKTKITSTGQIFLFESQPLDLDCKLLQWKPLVLFSPSLLPKISFHFTWEQIKLGLSTFRLRCALTCSYFVAFNKSHAESNMWYFSSISPENVFFFTFTESKQNTSCLQYDCAAFGFVNNSKHWPTSWCSKWTVLFLHFIDFLLLLRSLFDLRTMVLLHLRYYPWRHVFCLYIFCGSFSNVFLYLWNNRDVFVGWFIRKASNFQLQRRNFRRPIV